MKTGFRILIAVAVAATACTALFAAPKIQFEKESLDFGNVPSGKPINATYQFRNAGDADLEITGVRPGCGCTKAEAKKLKLAAGESSTIDAVFNSTGYSGPISKSITVTTNDTAHLTIVLQIKANIVMNAIVTPASYNFDSVRINGAKTLTLTVKPADPKVFAITKVVPVGEHISVPGFRKVETASGPIWEVYVVVKGGKTPGRVMESLRIENNTGNSPLLSAMIYGNVVQ